MNYKQKLGYMALGAGIMAIGIIIGQVITPNIEAQSNGVFDKITCRELEVVDQDGTPAIVLESKDYTKRLTFFDEKLDQDGTPAIVLESKDYTRRLTFFDYAHEEEAIILESTGDLGGGAKPINLLSIKGRITGHDIITRDLEIRDWEGYPTVRIQGGSSNGITIYRPSTFDPAIELMSDPNYENFLRISDASSNNAAILLISHREKHHENYNAVILADTRGENAFILKGDDIQNFLSIADKQDNDSVAFKAASIGGKSAVMNLSIKRNGKTGEISIW